MKKLLIIPIFILLLTGCGGESLTRTVCTNTNSLSEDALLASEYVIYALGDSVHILVSTESIRSENPDVLEHYRKTIEDIYLQYNRVPFYNNSIHTEDGFLTSITMVNYNRVNLDDLIRIDENNAAIIENGRVSLRILLEMYKDSGAICE